MAFQDGRPSGSRWSQSGIDYRKLESEINCGERLADTHSIVLFHSPVSPDEHPHTPGTLRVPQCIFPVGREHCLALPTSASLAGFGLGCLGPYFCTGVDPATLQRCPVAAASEEAR
jgi:hypothetical protein